jgi:hypothetical protein
MGMCLFKNEFRKNTRKDLTSDERHFFIHFLFPLEANYSSSIILVVPKDFCLNLNVTTMI